MRDPATAAALAPGLALLASPFKATILQEPLTPGDTVVPRAALQRNDTGRYARRPAAGQEVDEWVAAILHFGGDSVVREWIAADKLGLLSQLGVADNPWPM